MLHLLTLIKLAHLLGLVMGLGGAVLLDFTILTRGIVRPIGKFTIEQLHTLSRAVTWGLVLLWVTGAALLWLNLQEKPNYIENPKLWAKIIIVLILTLNGMLIHGYIMPIMKRQVGRRLFDGLSNRLVAVFSLIASVSIISWFTPFVLGKASELNFVTPMSLILSVYMLAVFAAWGGLLVAMSAVTTIQEQARDYEANRKTFRSVMHAEPDLARSNSIRALEFLNLHRGRVQAAE